MPSVPAMSPEDWELWRSLRTMNTQLARELGRRLQRDAGISESDHGILVTLSQAPDRRLRIGEIADRLDWEKSRVSHQVSRMEARGLLERVECDADGRGTWVAMTAEGRRTYLVATRRHGEDIRELVLDPLDDAQRAALEAAIATVLAAMRPSCEAARAEAEADEPAA